MSTWACATCGEQFDEAVSFCSSCGSDDIARTDVPDAAADKHPQSGGGQSDSGVQGPSGESTAERRTVPGQTPPGARAEQPATTSSETRATDETTATPSAASSESTAEERSTGEKVLMGGIGATILGALLPWVSITVLGTSVTKRGIDGDGRITAAIAIIVGAFYLAHWTRRAKLGSVVLGALVALLAFVYINDPAFGIDTADAETIRTMANIGVGLYLTAVGGVAMAYGSYRELGTD